MSEEELPEGWAATTIRESFDCWGGMTPSTGTSAFWDGTIPWVSSKDVKGDRISGGTEFVTARALEETRLRKCRPGTVLVVVRSGVLVHTLPVAITDSEVVINQDLKAIDSGEDLINEWLALALKAQASDILEASRKDGTTVQSVRVDQLLDRRLPIPPLAEQRQIVEKVEALLAQVNAARARLAKVPTILKRFRQSILSAACSGRLSEDWRKDHAPKEIGAMIADRLQRLHEPAGTGRRGNAAEPSDEAHDFDGSDLPETWAVCELLWLCDPARPITYGILKPGPDQKDGVLYVRVADFPGNRLKLADIRRTSRAIADAYKRSTLRAGDVLLSIRGTFGRVCRVPNELDGANITQDTARLSIHESIDPEYILAWLKSPSLQDRLGRSAKGAAVRGVNIGDVRALQVALPPLEEQHEIVRRVDALFKLADAIEARVVAATARADKITQAILAKAFRGELVPTEAELARQEGRDYEPSSALLARIRAARTAGVPVERTGRAAASGKSSRRRSSGRTG